MRLAALYVFVFLLVFGPALRDLRPFHAYMLVVFTVFALVAFLQAARRNR